MVSLDDIVTDVEAQPTTRNAAGRLVDRLAAAYLEAITKHADGGRSFAVAVASRSMDLCDAVIRVAEKPTGIDPPGPGVANR
jgi:hypothetical protein